MILLILYIKHSHNSVWNAGWIFYCLFTQRNTDTRQTHVQAPHKYMPKCFFNGFTSKCIKIPFSIIWKCIFLNYSSQGIEAPRSFKFFISAQLQTVDLVKGTQFWGVGIAAGRSWQDFQSRGTSRFFITEKQRNKSRSIKIRNERAEWLAVSAEQHRYLPQEGTRGLNMQNLSTRSSTGLRLGTDEWSRDVM